MTNNYFQGTKINPYHISIGAVVRNEKGEICCHYFKKFEHKSVGSFENLYLLMRETIEPNETIEQCLARGLMEEFGITANMVSYLGSIQSKFPIVNSEIVVEKTTLYFLCDFISINESQRKPDDLEASSEIVWVEPNKLIEIMTEQGIKTNREDADESVIIKRLIDTSKGDLI